VIINYQIQGMNTNPWIILLKLHEMTIINTLIHKSLPLNADRLLEY